MLHTHTLAPLASTTSRDVAEFSEAFAVLEEEERLARSYARYLTSDRTVPTLRSEDLERFAAKSLGLMSLDGLPKW
jgi:hypothetical protein